MNKIKKFSCLYALLMATTAQAGMDDDPLLYKVSIDQLEKRYSSNHSDPLILEADAWIGKDINKLWLKADAEKVDGELEELELQVLYRRAVDAYWDFTVGWKHNSKPRPKSDWLALGFTGLAPYWFEVDAAVYIADDGQTNLNLNLEYEWMLTQQWVLSPEAEINLYSKDDDATEIGAGLSSSQLGLRLKYEIYRELAPYIGINWNQKFGGTADHARSTGETSSDTQFVIGLSAWF
ncbi:MAG: copper resistance protein B [Gammaproteobacteria bacterium]|nr:copper resistance protein B [Gammaproteobacteria bacterium]MCW8923496.1 copper resistance protein B [Gammaproteobacteria bacterium]